MLVGPAQSPRFGIPSHVETSLQTPAVPSASLQAGGLGLGLGLGFAVGGGTGGAAAPPRMASICASVILPAARMFIPT